jgi:hypothetical protein
MSSGTFSLNPGPPSTSIDAQSFAGAITGGPITPASTAVSLLCLDVAAVIKEAPVPIVQQAYMRSAREFCARSMYLRRQITQASLTVNQQEYNFGSDPNLEVIGVAAAAIQQQDTTWVNLRPTDQATYDPNMKTDLPNWYSYLPEGMIVFYPTPNYAYGAKVSLICQPSLASQVIPNDLLNKFNTYIEAGALEFLYSMTNEAWANAAMEAQAHNRFWEGIGLARTWKDKGFQQASVRATPRPFIAR